MIKINYNFKLIEINKNEILEEYDKVIKAAMIKAIRAFLIAAVPKVPIYTGFARGAFRNLEDIAGRVENSAAGPRIRGTLKGATNLKAKLRKTNARLFYKGILKTADSGRGFSTKPGEILIIRGRNSVSFKFGIDIAYFDKLDREKWHSFQSGVEAFEETLNEYIRTHPIKIAKYVKRKDFTG